MENDQIRALVSQGNYFEIFRCDQLKRSIDYGEAFYGYKEGIIAFAPTYRYDIGTDNYDTSEKYRAPAWTDRILYRGKGIYQTSYERAEFRTSDHRPGMMFSFTKYSFDVLEVVFNLSDRWYLLHSHVYVCLGADSIGCGGKGEDGRVPVP